MRRPDRSSQRRLVSLDTCQLQIFVIENDYLIDGYADLPLTGRFDGDAPLSFQQTERKQVRARRDCDELAMIDAKRHGRRVEITAGVKMPEGFTGFCIKGN